MAFSASQYLSYATTLTATTSATTSPTTTAKFSVIAMTVSNSATSNKTTYADVGFYNGTVSTNILTKVPLIPGGCVVVEGFQHHVLPTSGYMYTTPYATTGIGVVVTGVEVT